MAKDGSRILALDGVRGIAILLVLFHHFAQPVPLPRLAARLEKDRVELLAFYDFPAEHWQHLGISNPIESTFATVRLRTYRTKGPGSRKAGLAMAFKLAEKAQNGWKKLDGSAKLQDLINAIVFVDGERKAA